jgi:hypothetical protein
MTTILDVVTLALRQGRVIGVNASPTSSEAAAGLQAFQGMIDTMISTPTFGALVDVYEIYNYTAGEGERVISPTAITVTFPDTIDDESIGEDRPPYDLSIVETVLAGNRTVKLYDRTGWVTLTDLTLASDAPLASRGLTGLAACVARTYCEMFGRDLGPNTQRLAAQFMLSLSMKRGTNRARTPAEYM